MQDGDHARRRKTGEEGRADPLQFRRAELGLEGGDGAEQSKGEQKGPVSTLEKRGAGEAVVD